MENMNVIIITALVTLIVTVIAGIAVEYFKNIKAKIKYSVRESIPIELNGKKIGANIIDISNPSSKTVKDITLKIQAIGVEIRNGGINTTVGLDYNLIENNDTIEVKIPFLKSKDMLSITTILENEYSIPNKPNVTIRSPDNFKTIIENDNQDKFSIMSFLPALIAAATVGASLSIVNIYMSRDQSVTLVLSASLVDLPDLAEKYITSTGIHYYNQGPYIYALAKNSKDPLERKKYIAFLINTIDTAENINSGSKAALSFFIAKIYKLQEDHNNSQLWYIKSKDANSNEYANLINYYKNENSLVPNVPVGNAD